MGFLSSSSSAIVTTPGAVQEHVVATPAGSSSINSQAPLKTIAVVSVGANSNKLIKVTLTATLSSGAYIAYPLQFNPETLQVAEDSSFGQYGGVTYKPRMYYGGVKANKMSIRYFAVDRVNGLLPTLNSVKQFSNPDPTVVNNYATPPLTTMTYGKTGSFVGYVERPLLEIEEWQKDLTPIRGYVSFTFNVIEFVPGTIYNTASIPVQAATISQQFPSVDG